MLEGGAHAARPWVVPDADAAAPPTAAASARMQMRGACVAPLGVVADDAPFLVRNDDADAVDRDGVQIRVFGDLQKASKETLDLKEGAYDIASSMMAGPKTGRATTVMVVHHFEVDDDGVVV